MKIILTTKEIETTDLLQIWLSAGMMDDYLRILQEIIDGTVTPMKAAEKIEGMAENLRK